MTRVVVLTPPGTGAIATVEVSGPRAWEFARRLFRPAGKPLPDTPELHRFWFGTLGEGAGDEVILAVTAAPPPHPEPPPGGGSDLSLAGRGVAPAPLGGDTARPRHGEQNRPTSPRRGEVGPGAAPGPGEGALRTPTVEVHCHGGRRVVRWVIEQFLSLGCTEGEPTRFGSVLDVLQRAPTLRTASILLDQLHGAFDAAVRRVLASPDLNGLRELARFAAVGRHLVEPWKVVIAGPPNVGKSSLVNALAGYQRAVVSPVAGTTRDAVRVQLAFDGWPVELADTAGLRDAEGLEAEGIDRAKRVIIEANLVVWVIDATDPVPPPDGHAGLVVWNKSDLAIRPPPGFAVSALTGAGIPELVSEMVRRFVPHPPPPGAAVPYTPGLADRLEAAVAADPAEAVRLLRACLPAG